MPLFARAGVCKKVKGPEVRIRWVWSPVGNVEGTDAGRYCEGSLFPKEPHGDSGR
jgi:hypothetical protein